MTQKSPPPSWDRSQWAAYADELLLAVRPYATPGRARFQLPGEQSGLGHDVDGLEGFARTFLMAGFRLAGERGADPLGLAEWYADGLAAGTDPGSPERWLRLEEHAQAKVEAASIALILDLTRPWIWDRLGSGAQRNVVNYLASAVGDDTYPQINWVWFRLVVQTFLRSVDGPHSLDEMAADLATHDTFVKADGWLADGDTRAFDHYTGWALHLYPTLWARMSGAEDLAAPRRDRDRALLDRFLLDALKLVGGDGSPLIQGRSLVYRFAAAAPFWVGALAGVPSSPAGQLRRAASRILEHFSTHGVPNERGLLDLGWFHEWPRLAQVYSGTGSPYWASKGMLGLSLPADHPAWTEPEVPLPSETSDALTVMRAPGWLVSSTVGDGVVRVVNHGTDHANAGDTGGDSPLYARLGYSTATAPLLDPESWRNPLDNSVAVLDANGNASHRTGMELLALRIDDTGAGPLGVAASRTFTHWLEPAAVQQHHGPGFVGEATPAGLLQVVSLLRGPLEIRLARLTEIPERAVTLRSGGWPVTSESPLTSTVRPLTSPGRAGHDRRSDASPLGTQTTTPYVDFPVADGLWTAVLVELSGTPSDGDCTVDVAEGPSGTTVTAMWPDGARTRTTIDHPDNDTSGKRTPQGEQE